MGPLRVGRSLRHLCRDSRGTPDSREWSFWGLGVGCEPGGEVLGGQDAQVGLHAVVAEAAELGAEDGVGSGDGGGEVDVNRLAGDGVLFEPHLGDREAVDDVLGLEAEVYFSAQRQDEFTRDEVVGGVGVGGVEAEGVGGGGVGEGREGAAEGGVGAGIVEVPGELGSGDLDLEGGEGWAGVTGGGPEALGLEGEHGEEEGESGEGEGLDEPRAAGFGGGSTEGEAGEEGGVGKGSKGQR